MKVLFSLALLVGVLFSGKSRADFLGSFIEGMATAAVNDAVRGEEPPSAPAARRSVSVPAQASVRDTSTYGLTRVDRNKLFQASGLVSEVEFLSEAGKDWVYVNLYRSGEQSASKVKAQFPELPRDRLSTAVGLLH